MRAELRKFHVKVVIVNPGDAPNETPLTSGQDKHFTDMEREMTGEERTLHADLFYKCQQYYTNLFPLPPLTKINNQNYYRIMETVLRSESPRPYYSNSGWATSVVFGLISSLPRHLSDIARLTIMKCYDHK